MKFRLALASTAALALAACGSADDASTEAEADTVEIPANDALDGVDADAVADEDAAMPEEVDEGPSVSEQAQIEEAGDDAAAAAADVADAIAEEANDAADAMEDATE